MARSTQKEATQETPAPSPTPSPQPNQDQVSLQGPLADVPEYGPSEEIIIDKVNSKPVIEPGPPPVVVTDDDGNITIK